MPAETPSRKPDGILRRTARGTRIAAALFGAVLVSLVGLLALQRVGQPLVLAGYDLPHVISRGQVSDQIRIVYLDKLDGNSLDRRPQAALLDQLNRAGARAVVYDLIFDQASADPEVDLAFAAAMRRFRGVDEDGNPIAGAPERHVFLACGRQTFHETGMAGEQLIPPTDVLLDAADDFGVVAFEVDGYLVRKLSTGTRDEPGLMWKTAAALGAPLEEDRRGETRWLHFLGPPPDENKRDSEPAIPSFDANFILGGDFNIELFRDKIVVIGGKPGIVGEALGKDLFNTPFHRFRFGGRLPFMSGVEVQATALANLLSGNWLARSAPRFELLMVLVAGCVTGIWFSLIRPVPAIFGALATLCVMAFAGWASMNRAHIWFPWTVVAFAQVPVALVWGAASHSYIERYFRLKLTAEQAAIRSAFAKYLSPQMLERLTEEGFTTNLGGEKTQAAMMFTDLECFTDMCERVGDPVRIVETLNDYFERTTGSIFDHDGVVIKYIGDAIFAVWGAPLPDADAPVKAVRAAWRLHQADRVMVDGLELKTRIGLHFGEVVAGNIGSSRRVDYTLIGDAVNLSARLEGINKMFDTNILMSDAVHARLNGEFRTRMVGRFRVKGRREVVTVHELLGPALQQNEPEWIALYQRAVSELQENRPEAALECFVAADAAREPRGDGPSRFFISRLREGEGIPDGVYDMKEK
jgi:adenylate cyclase